MTVQRLTLILEESEMDALRREARMNLRKPRDQARYLIRLALAKSAANVAPPPPLSTPEIANGAGSDPAPF